MVGHRVGRVGGAGGGLAVAAWRAFLLNSFRRRWNRRAVAAAARAMDLGSQGTARLCFEAWAAGAKVRRAALAADTEVVAELGALRSEVLKAGAYTRPLFGLNVSTFCAILWVHDFPPVY